MELKFALNELDKNEIRLMMRPGIILPILLFILSSLITFILYVLTQIDLASLVIIEGLIILCALFLHLIMTLKLKKDIRSGLKIAKLVQVDKRKMEKDTIAGSGAHGMEMKEYVAYNLIIDHVKYRVSKEIHDGCYAGDMIYMFYTTHSHNHIGFGLPDKKTEITM